MAKMVVQAEVRVHQVFLNLSVKEPQTKASMVEQTEPDRLSLVAVVVAQGLLVPTVQVLNLATVATVLPVPSQVQVLQGVGAAVVLLIYLMGLLVLVVLAAVVLVARLTLLARQDRQTLVEAVVAAVVVVRYLMGQKIVAQAAPALSS
jgi:hypothetical protein